MTADRWIPDQLIWSNTANDPRPPPPIPSSNRWAGHSSGGVRITPKPIDLPLDLGKPILDELKMIRNVLHGFNNREMFHHDVSRGMFEGLMALSGDPVFSCRMIKESCVPYQAHLYFIERFLGCCASTVTRSEVLKLPGVGPVKADQIMKWIGSLVKR